MIETIVLVITAFITSVLSAIIGMGGGITLLGVMAIVIPEGYMVVAFHGITQLVSNITRTTVYREHIYKPILKKFFIGIIPGLVFAVLIIIGLINFFDFQSASEFKIDLLKPLIGIYIIWFLYLKKKKKIQSDGVFLLMGILSGLVTVFIGAAGPLIAPFFIDRNLSKENIVATKAACQAIGHIGKIPIFIYFFGVNYFHHWYVLLPLVLAVYSGTKIGKWYLGKLSEQLFTKLFRFVLTMIAARLIFEQLLKLF